MTRILEQIGTIRGAVAALAEVAPPSALPLVQALSDWLADGIDLAATLGLPQGWRADYRRASRDKMLHDLAGRYFPTLAGRPLACAVALAARRYQGSSWPRDRKSRRRPDGLPGMLFDILSVGEMPGVERLLQLFKGLGV